MSRCQISLQQREALPELLPTYDPNIRWAKHTVEITYMQWDYRCTVLIEIGGNTRGADLFKSAIDVHAGKLFEEFGDEAELTLLRPAEDGDGEDRLIIESDGEDLEDWLSDLCVACRFVKHEREPR